MRAAGSTVRWPGSRSSKVLKEELPMPRISVKKKEQVEGEREPGHRTEDGFPVVDRDTVEREGPPDHRGSLASDRASRSESRGQLRASSN